MQKTLHANEQGPVFVVGKPYYWDKNDEGRLVLKAWPVLEDGKPGPHPLGVEQ
jgi:hypothetical protein